jgi:hypothetical protein
MLGSAKEKQVTALEQSRAGVRLTGYGKKSRLRLICFSFTPTPLNFLTPLFGGQPRTTNFNGQF